VGPPTAGVGAELAYAVSYSNLTTRIDTVNRCMIQRINPRGTDV
jgi:hypothetical protein